VGLLRVVSGNGWVLDKVAGGSFFAVFFVGSVSKPIFRNGLKVEGKQLVFAENALRVGSDIPDV
jgi:hypothetical protein